MAISFLSVLSQFLGLIYLGCWSFCNVPQFILNCRRKSVSGFSITFQALNMVGFVNYFIFLVYGYVYQHQHNLTQSVLWQDLMWCASSIFWVYATAVQIWLYRATISESIHPFYQFSIVAIIVLSVYNLFLARAGYLDWWSEAEGFEAYSFMHFLGFSKTYISFIKYLPQVLLNFHLKNTRGFSIIAVLLDITGAFTSFLQAFVNAFLEGEDGPNFQTIFGNLPKFFLSMESIFFCGILSFQHYFLYAEENDRLASEVDTVDHEATTQISLNSPHDPKTATNEADSGSDSDSESELDHDFSRESELRIDLRDDLLSTSQIPSDQFTVTPGLDSSTNVSSIV